MAEAPLKETVLLEWEAPERIPEKHKPVYFKNLFTLLAILAAVAIFFKEFVLALMLGALGFVKWAMGTKDPQSTKYIISNLGIRTHGHPYTWDQLKDFWFGETDGHAVLQITTKNIYPGRLYLVINSGDKSKITEILSSHLPYRQQVREDPMQKVSAKLSRWFPLE